MNPPYKPADADRFHQIFSALYKMLPSAKTNLIAGGLSQKAAAWTLVSCFLAGAAGIQIISHICHQYTPSHVVECDHSHTKEEDEAETDSHNHDHSLHDHSSHPSGARQHVNLPTHSQSGYGAIASSQNEPIMNDNQQAAPGEPGRCDPPQPLPVRRPSIQALKSAASSLFHVPRNDCDPERGQCYGTSDLCPKACFDIIQSRRPSFHHFQISRPGLARATTDVTGGDERQRLLPVIEEPRINLQALAASELPPEEREIDSTDSSDTIYDHDSTLHKSTSAEDDNMLSSHHHHVPDNNFLSIGLQTSIAIALHKLVRHTQIPII